MAQTEDVAVRDAFAVERREHIRRLVAERGRVKTSELSRLLHVTEPTVRKDIAALAEQGQLVKAHGGAVARRSGGELDVADREQLHAREKRAVAERCVDLVGAKESVFLDGGTTTTEIARVIVERSLDDGPGSLRDVKVLTTSLRVAELCGPRPGDGVLVVGGRYRPVSGTNVGPLAVAALRQFRVDIAFLGTGGVTEDGFFVADLAEAEVKREMLRRASKVVIPLDHHKVGLSDFVEVCPLDEVDIVVTDQPDPDLTEWLEETSVELLISNKER